MQPPGNFPKSKSEREYFRGARYARRNPYPLMLWLAIGGSTIVFAFMVFMLLVRKFTVGLPPVHIPVIFIFSTLVIALSSGTLSMSQGFLKDEDYRGYLNWMGITVVFGAIFMLSQIIGFYQLYRQGFTLANNHSLAYLYLLAGLHFGHIIVAITLLFWNVLDASRSKNYVDSFIQTLNPAKQTRLLVAIRLWHYIDILWLILFAIMYTAFGD